MMPRGNASRKNPDRQRVDDPPISDPEMVKSLLATRGGADAEPSPEPGRDNDPNGQSRKQLLKGVVLSSLSDPAWKQVPSSG